MVMHYPNCVAGSSLNATVAPQARALVRHHASSCPIPFVFTDLARVTHKLVESHGETYALRVAFTIRTAVELHR